MRDYKQHLKNKKRYFAGPILYGCEASAGFRQCGRILKGLRYAGICADHREVIARAIAGQAGMEGF